MVDLVKKTREKAGRKAEPSYALIDSQSVKTTSASEQRGIDCGKNDRAKTYIVADIMGNLLVIAVHAANIYDTNYGGKVFAAVVEEYPTIKGVCAGAGYRKSFENDVKAMD